MNNVTVRLHRARQAMQRALLLLCETCPEHDLGMGCGGHGRRHDNGDEQRAGSGDHRH